MLKLNAPWYWLLVGMMVCVFFTPLQGQDSVQTDTTKSAKPYQLILLPAVFFTPETNWGFGVASLVTLRSKNRPSQFQLGFAYTLNKQFLTYLPYQLFLKEDQYKVYGELGYYRYIYAYFGNGNDTRKADEELYSVNYPRVRINALYALNKHWFVGLRYWLDNFDITKTKEGGILANQEITGNQGGLLSGTGMVLNYDSRDHLFTPQGGTLAELVLFANGSFLGSDFNFQKLYIDISHYFSFIKNQTLAVQFYTELTAGKAPFNQLSLLGGTKRMRGFFEGRYRDNHYAMMQAEYRLPLFWRLGLTGFFTTGKVAGNFKELGKNKIHYTYGAGLRIMMDTKSRVNLRIDAGFGPDTSGFYVTFGEAF